MNWFDLSRHGLNQFEQFAIMGVLVVAVISLAYAWLLRGKVLQKDKGTQKMQEVWNAIRIGSDSYLSRQLRTSGDCKPVVVSSGGRCLRGSDLNGL